MTYNLGVVGVGHWFERLYAGMVKTNDIRLLKVASASGIEKKRDQISRLGVPEENYYKIDGFDINDGFFDGIDAVQISDPVEFHASQTLQALSRGVATITEKSWAANRADFDKVVKYITANGLEEKSYLHLHYLHKLLTIELPELLTKFTGEHGRIVGTSATFFEVENLGEQTKRKWLFSMNNGGLFMDWIHPFEVYFRGAGAARMDLSDITNYMVNDKYSTVNPTGVYAHSGLEGEFFKKRVHAKIRIAKGVGVGQQKEAMAFVFESGHRLGLNFIHSEIEFTSDIRGTWELYDADGLLVDSGAPKGPTSSDILVNDIVCLCKGKNLGLTVQDVAFLFKPQWQYQDSVSKSGELVKDRNEVEGFISDGLANKV
ncbi:MAG: hypothetical protein KGH72_03315 [Candidatus Micrarchaeota archaeon]|nr:hypothetical protein [Candidatus Micrarchaeota archaeon]